MNLKSLTIEEVKEKYIDRNGFVFQGAVPSDPQKCEKIANILLEKGFSEELPELVAQLDNRTFCFIYPESASFATPALIKFANQWAAISQAFQVDALSAWLKTK